MARDHITSHKEKELRQQKTTGQTLVHNHPRTHQLVSLGNI